LAVQGKDAMPTGETVNEVRPAPRAVLSYLPFLWSQVLFSGPSPKADRIRWGRFLLLLLLPGIIVYPCLSFYLFEPDEGRYAEIPREMLVRGEWTVPYLQGEPYLDKPPLLYWLVMMSYQIFGVHDVAARLMPALAVHGTILVTYLLGRRSLGERAAFWGALALGLAPGFVSIGRLLVLDGLLTFWVTLSLFSVFEAVRENRFQWGWWLLAAASSGLGILTKGPVALVLLLPPLWMHEWLTGDRVRLGWRRWFVFVAVVLALVMPWYVAMSCRISQFVSYFFWEQNVVRFLSPFDHLRPVWFYLPVIFGGLLPISLLALPFFRFLFSGVEEAAERRTKELGFMLLAGGWCVFFFSLSGCKLPTYILPALPFLALALATYATQSSWVSSRWVQASLALSFLILCAGHYVAIPWFARFHSPMSHAAEVERFCEDPSMPVVCYPRNYDSVSFYLRRDDLKTFRSKETHLLIQFLRDQPRTVVLFSHRHSLKGLQHAMETMAPELRMTDVMPIAGSIVSGFRKEFCYLAVVTSSPTKPPSEQIAASARP
jgi:4-amino-4-deoxy-L-arabinose transferase-like glycosyltransferase